MDWARAIERNSEALNGIVAALFAMLGLDGSDTVARIPQPLHRAVLRVLRPAESAMRRLIIIAARGLVVKLAPSRALPAGPIGKGGPIRQSGPSRPSFQLFDPRKNFAELRQHRRKFTRNPPRIHFFPYDPRVAALWAARLNHPASTLADLYDRLTMPPDLRMAHTVLDLAVDRLYRKEPFATDRERVEFLLARYEQIAAPAPALAAQKPKRAKNVK